MSARFEVIQGDSGWWSRFVAPNGRIVWTTETYSRRRTALAAIASFIAPFEGCWIDDWWYYRDRKAYAPAVVYRRDSWNKTDGLRIEIREVDERVQP